MRIASVVEDCYRLSERTNGMHEVLHPRKRLPKCQQGHSGVMLVTNRWKYIKGFLKAWNRFVKLLHGLISYTQVNKGTSFRGPIARTSKDHKCIILTGDRLVELALPPVDISKISERLPFTASVPEFLSDN
jgi:hypothetical protein